MTLSMARSSAISSCPLTAMDDSASPSATRCANSVVSRSGWLTFFIPYQIHMSAMRNTTAMEAPNSFIWYTTERLYASI